MAGLVEALPAHWTHILPLLRPWPRQPYSSHTQTKKEKWKLKGRTCRRTYMEQKEWLWDGGRERERGSIISMFYVSLWETTFRAWMGSCHAASREHLWQPDMNTGPCDRINYCELKALPCDVPPSALPCHMSGVLLSPSSLSPRLPPSRSCCSFPARRSSYVSPSSMQGESLGHVCVDEGLAEVTGTDVEPEALSISFPLRVL